MDLDRAFQDGTPYQIEDERGTITTECLGDLIVPSGAIVACDAIVNVNVTAFEQPVPPGRYPVFVSIANPTTGYLAGKSYVAYAQLRIAGRPAVRWVMATRPGEDLATLDPDNEDDYFGYPVDSAHGCFMDVVAQSSIDNLALADSETLTADLIAEMQRDKSPFWLEANVTVEPTTGANLIAFMAGIGDGIYPSFWGHDEAGEVVSLVTDFCLLDFGRDARWTRA
jgi:hypothetical protein